jgi:hypothetical protein
VLVRGRDGIVAGGGLPDDAEVALLLQQPGHGLAHAGVVVRDDDGDLTADGGHRSTLAYGAAIVVMRAHRRTSAHALDIRSPDVSEARVRLGG